MTLNTRIEIFPGSTQLPDARKLWDICALVCKVPDGYEPEVKEVEYEQVVESELGIGAKAWISVREDGGQRRVNLDTTYSGDGSNVHNQVVKALIAALPSDCHILAQDEFSGGWHYRKPPYS